MRLRGAALAAIIPALVSALLTVMTSGCAAAQPARAAAGLTASHATSGPGGSPHGRAAVPWSHVGPGWVLTQYASAPPEGGPGPAALYLISPGGTRYQLASWPSWRSAPQLVAWSPDGQRALFQVVTGRGGAEQLTLASGQVSRFGLPGGASVIGYTTPRGLNIVAGQPHGDGTSLARYTLSGWLAHSLGYSADGQILYQPSGAGFVTGTSNGLELAGQRRRPDPQAARARRERELLQPGPLVGQRHRAGVLRTGGPRRVSALAGAGERCPAQAADAAARSQQPGPG